jgi:hypothetical protein
MRNARLLYTAVVRPAILYGTQEWSIRDAAATRPSHLLKPLEKIQNSCLRKITGAYKRTPRAMLEKEAQVIPLDLYTQTITRRRALQSQDHSVEKDIRRTANTIWRRMRRARESQARPTLLREELVVKTKTRVQEALQRWERARIAQATRSRGTGPPSEDRLLSLEAVKDWKARWEKAKPRSRRHLPTTWTTPWEYDNRKLYAGLTKAEATAVFLLRTEVIGLNAWLASIQVPETFPSCECGWPNQTVRHVLLHCPRYSREHLLQACGTERLDEILGRPAAAAHAAR